MNFRYYFNWLAKYKLKLFIQNFPRSYKLLQKWRFRNKKYSDNLIDKKSNIVIEGYPRSANSFSVKAFRFSNNERMRIATHLHSYTQIITGVRHNIPILMTIRDPYSAVSSYATFKAKNIGIEKFKKEFNVKWLIKEYIYFYEKLVPYKGKIVVAKFDDILNDYGEIIQEVNFMYNTSFVPFVHNEKNVKSIFNSSGKHLSPSVKRDNIKLDLAESVNLAFQCKEATEANRLFKYWTRD